MKKNNIIDLIGDTPLIRLNYPSSLTGCEIYGKAEFVNPGGSIKDRAALSIIEEAEKNQKLQKGGYIIEGTAGNTGIGLTLIANAKGYNSIIVMPETQTKEKIDLLRSMGADLRLVPAKPYKDKIVEVNTTLKISPKENIKDKVLTEITYSALVTIDEGIKDEKEIEKIILINVPTDVYPILYETFVYLFKQAGVKNINIEKEIDFEKKYKENKGL